MSEMKMKTPHTPQLKPTLDTYSETIYNKENLHTIDGRDTRKCFGDLKDAVRFARRRAVRTRVRAEKAVKVQCDMQHQTCCYLEHLNEVGYIQSQSCSDHAHNRIDTKVGWDTIQVVEKLEDAGRFARRWRAVRTRGDYAEETAEDIQHQTCFGCAHSN